MEKISVLFLILTILVCRNCANIHDNNVFDEKPLILTPFIENNQIEKAKLLSKVDYIDFNSVASYTGYLTVNKSSNGNLFFWFIKANTNNWADSPLVLWLQGGPGASSLFGLFTENGPFNIVTEDQLTLRKYSWHIKANLIYIDNPVGTGFSFTDENGYSTNQDQVATNLYNALLQFYKLFPELQSNRLIVSGESYGGKYVPALSAFIDKKNEMSNDFKIKLDAILIGNGMTDPINQLQYGDYLYQLGLIDRNALKIFHEYEEKIANFILKEKYMDAYNTFNEFIGFDSNTALFLNLTGFETHFNYLHPENDRKDELLANYLNKPEIRKALHVGNNKFVSPTDENIVLEHLKGDIFKSIAHLLPGLLSNHHVVVYNGQLDIICAYPMMVNYLLKLKFNGDTEYRNNRRYIYRVDKELAGYVKEGGNLTEVLIRKAGHMVPADMPKYTFDIISRLADNKEFY